MLFENCLAEEFFALNALNSLKSVAPIFPNYLTDLFFVSDRFGGWWDSTINGSKGIN